jgi:hypothetical protein
MARQIMKALAMLMLIGGLTAASAVVASGQSGRTVKADVPFDFIVAEKTLRAGNYDIGIPNGGGEALAIRSRDGGERLMRLSHAARRVSDGNLTGKLVFHRYGSTYFLAQAWTAGESSGCELPKSRQERAIESELKKIAAYHGDNTPVYELVEVIATGR